MALKPGTLLGPYEVLALIGAGGMGEVYKGRDTRLDRLVALKVLAPHLVDHPEARQRFEREAQTVANLKHPNICVLYDIGKQEAAASEGTPAALLAKAGFEAKRIIHFLVLEYLEGETLAQRLAKGSLPLEQVLQYAAEVSDALDKAHRAGVTHRDIKPGNIMIVPQTGSGPKTSTKLLDFGLAKLKQEVLPNLPRSEWPTGLGAPTVQGTILGTPHYMAPEQAEGKVDELDARTDIFSFGATVYEMVTGKKAFDGQTPTSVIAKILETDPPPMSSLQPLTPPALDHVVRKCLAKDPEDRWQTARDLCHELTWIRESTSTRRPEAPPVRTSDAEPARVEASEAAKPPVPEAMPAPAAKGWRRTLPVGMAGLIAIVLAIAAGLAVWTLKPSAPPAPRPVTRTAINLPAGQRLAALDQPAIAISPDGKNLVYVAVQSRDREGAGVRVPTGGQPPLADARGSDTGTQQLYLRPLDSQEAKPIAGTEGAVAPFFSPDGQWIGFFAGGKLKKVSVNGGSAVTLANTATPGGASWGSRGSLAFVPNNTRAVQEVAAEGGAPQPLTRLDRGEVNHRWPEWLPEGRAVLFAALPSISNLTNAQIVVQATETGERRKLVQGATQPRYASSGHLLYAQAGTLMAARFDARKLAVTGAAVPVLEGLLQSTSSGSAQYSASATGTLVYVAGAAEGSQRRPVWVSRNGEEQALPAPPHVYRYARVSPDGRRVAVTIEEQESQVWLYDLARDTLTRLTFEGTDNGIPAWSPDGKRIAFASSRAGPGNLFWQLADGSGRAERLTTSEYGHFLGSFSPDGQLLAFHEDRRPTTGRDIWVLRLSDHKAQPFLQTQYEEGAPRFSPDGRWLAYVSDESGRYEVYVQPYPGPGGKWQISTEGGGEPVWNADGRELFYRQGNRMVAVEVTIQPTFSAGKPKTLFEGPYLPVSGMLQTYDVSPDGQRFLMLKPVETQTSAPTQINVVLNWFEELKRRVPAAK